MIEKICDEIGITSNELIIKSLQQENKNLKEIIDKAIKHVSLLSSKGRGCEIYADVKKEILDILKGDNNVKN